VDNNIWFLDRCIGFSGALDPPRMFLPYVPHRVCLGMGPKFVLSWERFSCVGVLKTQNQSAEFLRRYQP